VTGSFIIETLKPGHDRSRFSSGVSALDRYLREQATQDVRRRATAVFVTIEAPDARIAGYYTLAAAGVPLADLPDSLTNRLPRNPSVPVARVGRLAVDLAFRRRKLGAVLLWDAGMRAVQSDVAVFALVVYAKDEQAESFYQHHGFMAFGRESRQLILPLATFAKA
jgi:GNAT superfamily N-acetyltransferase